MQVSEPFRQAVPDDADLLAELENCAGEGLPLYVWSKMAKDGESAWDVGRRLAVGDDGCFSGRNSFVIEVDGHPAGALIGYEIADPPEPFPAETPAPVKPICELQNLVPATWCIDALAVQPEFRGHGLGSKLIGLAEAIGAELGKRGTSLIVSDANHGARRLYERCGYKEVATRPMVKDGWVNDGENWVLLAKMT